MDKEVSAMIRLPCGDKLAVAGQAVYARNHLDVFKTTLAMWFKQSQDCSFFVSLFYIVA